MVKREHVTDARGRKWVSGGLDSDTWFSEVRANARAQARRRVAAALSRPTRSRWLPVSR